MRSAVRSGGSVTVALFASWTLFVWVGRLRNLWLDTGGLRAAGRLSLLGAVVFSALGLALAVVWAAGRFRSSPSMVGSAAVERPLVLALAALTGTVWLIRGVDIALDDHRFGFIAVHLVLALVSFGFAASASRSVLRTVPGVGDRSRPRPRPRQPSQPADPGRSPVG